jgi:arsenite-transporting ATPase
MRSVRHSPKKRLQPQLPIKRERKEHVDANRAADVVEINEKQEMHMIMEGHTTQPSFRPLDWRGWQTRFLFFTGKGGVGKTTIASTVAVQAVAAGKRVLVVSTDPASNLDDVFAMSAGSDAAPVPGINGLFVMNLDPEAAAAAYRERVVAPYRTLLPTSAIRSMEEQLSGACTVEIAAFNEFTRIIATPELSDQFDQIIFDTAPTGHTLRLLTLPSAWSGFIAAHPHGASCLGPLAGLEAQRAHYEQTVQMLADAAQTTLLLVSRPEASALQEAARAGGELMALGIANQQLILNGVFPTQADHDAVAAALIARQHEALAALPAALQQVPMWTVPLVASDLTGIAALSGLATATENADPFNDEPDTAHENGQNGQNGAVLDGLDDLVRHLANEGHGVVMMMGKGGVGKTTLAAAVAVALAHQEYAVHLSTTDPAAHVARTVGQHLPARLTVSRIDPAVEGERYTEEVLAASGALDEEGRALLEEDLHSPCTEEIAVFRAFARTVEQAEGSFVILDTAPTGHTLLLLDAAQSYHREVSRSVGAVPEAVRVLLPRLRDARFTKILIMTLPEATPVQEAERLQTDLRRAGIEPFGWVINASMTTCETRHPVLVARSHLEQRYIQQVHQQLAARTWLVPWYDEAPTGESALLAMTARP